MRRLMLWALACITLGAATTVGCVIVLVAWLPRSPTRAFSSHAVSVGGEAFMFTATRSEARGFHGYFVCGPFWLPPADRFTVPPDPPTRAVELPPHLVEGILPDWFVSSDTRARLRDFLTSPSTTFDDYMEIEFCGWPYPVAYSISHFKFINGALSMMTTTGRVFPPSDSGPRAPVVIPVQPVRGGFAADTAVFAGAWAVLPVSFSIVRGVRRRRRAGGASRAGMT